MATIPGQGNTSYTQVSALDKILAVLKQIRTEVSTTAVVAAGDATAANQVLQTNELVDINTNTTVLTTLDKGSGLVSSDTLRVVLEDVSRTEINGILTFLNSLSIGAAAVNLGLTVTLSNRDIDMLESINTYSSNISSRVDLENWDKIVGNSKEFTWVAGTLGQVVSTIEYYAGVALIVTQTFTYDANDNVLTITAS